MYRVSKVKWNPFSEGYLQNPYKHVNLCRETNPIQKILPDSYMFFSYKDVSQILKSDNVNAFSISNYLKTKESRIFKNTNSCPFLSKSTEMWSLYLNDEVHSIVRKSMTKAFHKQPLQEIFQDCLEKTLLEYKNQSNFDLVDFCVKFKYYIVCEIFNLNEIGFESVKELSSQLAEFQSIYNTKKFYQSLNDNILIRKPSFDGDSIFKQIITEEAKNLSLEPDQVYSVLLASFMAAFEATKNNLILSIVQILRNKDLTEFAISMDNKSKKMLFQENIRFNSVAQYSVRENSEPFEINDIKIPEKSKLYLCIASANRDENIFTKANTFIPQRDKNPHLGFGEGIHKCIGKGIAQMEVDICLQPMINFLKDYSIETVSWSKQFFMRTPNQILISKKGI